MATVIALILASALAGPASRDVRSQELLSSVIISGTCSHGCHGETRLFGTGEIVARRGDGRLVVLTARHVVANMTEPRVYVRNAIPQGTSVTTAVNDRRGSPASIVSQSAESDLAVVDFRPAMRDAYAVATLAQNDALDTGNVVGGPNGALWTVSPYRAIVSDDRATLVSCATCGPGDSGGGVFDRNGALSGILVSQQVFLKSNESPATATRSSNFKIVPLADVRAFVATISPEAPPGTEPLPVANDDPWSRFDTRAASQAASRERDPWARFTP